MDGKWCSSPVWLSPDASAMPVIGVAWNPRSANSSAAAATIRSRVSPRRPPPLGRPRPRVVRRRVRGVVAGAGAGYAGVLTVAASR